MTEQQRYDFTETLPDLDAGLFLDSLSHALKETAVAVVAHGDNKKTGKVTVEFTMRRIGEGHQVEMQHKLSFAQPTRRGKATEEATTLTAPVYVDLQRGLSVVPHDQLDAFKPNRENA